MAFLPAASGVVDDGASEVERLKKQISFYATEVDLLAREKVTLRNALDEKTRLYDQLRKVASYIPGHILRDAKGKAGLDETTIVLM